MTDLDIKKEIIQRICVYLIPTPPGAVNDLLGKSIQELGVILERLVTTKAQGDSEDTAQAYAEEMRRASAFDGAYVHGLRNISLNGKKLIDCESNRSMFESLLQAHEEPSASLYGTMALTYPTKFSWEAPRVQPTREEQRTAFDAFARANDLSGCEANFELFKQGASTENFAGASGVDRATRSAEDAQARQKFLINSATPSQLKQEAAWESQQNREQAQRDEADRAHKFVSQAQAGLYSPLPTHNQAGELMDSKYFRRLSTVDFAAFKVAVKKWGTAQITERLRTPAAPTV
jgi:hypothetical protein